MSPSQAHILVTGASRGIGAAVVSALEARGARVVGQATTEGEGRLAADFAEPGAADRLWRQALVALDGRIDVLINNAGVFEGVSIEAPDAEWRQAWDRSLNINLRAAADLSRNAVSQWRGQGRGGRIVNIASRSAHRGDSPDHWHYAAAKAGLVAMTKTIARAYAAPGVLAFAVCPGFVVTGDPRAYMESRGGERLLADIPLGRVTEPEEVARLAAFLALDAPAAMTGAVLDINGASYVR